MKYDFKEYIKNNLCSFPGKDWCLTSAGEKIGLISESLPLSWHKRIPSPATTSLGSPATTLRGSLGKCGERTAGVTVGWDYPSANPALSPASFPGSQSWGLLIKRGEIKGNSKPWVSCTAWLGTLGHGMQGSFAIHWTLPFEIKAYFSSLLCTVNNNRWC